MTRLHVFDMDGTLLEGSACLEICRHLGCLEEVLKVEDAWSRGEVGPVEFYEILLQLWDGLTEEGIDQVFAVTPWLTGVREVFADISRRGERSAVISLSPQFFVDRLLAWELGTAHGAGVFVGVPIDPELVLTPESKVILAEQLMERYGVAEEDCVAYGDSSSDVPLFGRLENTVSVNGSKTLRAIAAVAYDGSDMREAYRLGRELIDRPRSRRRAMASQTTTGVRM